MALEKCSRRLLILDQCFDISGLGPDYMTFRYRQIVLLCNDFFRRGLRLSRFLLLHFDNLVRELDQFKNCVERVPGLCDGTNGFVNIPNCLIFRILLLDLEPSLLEERPCGVGLGGAVADWEIERDSVGEVERIAIEHACACRAHGAVEAREAI